MAEYFLVLDGARFEGELRPALAQSWAGRSFAPCRELCVGLVAEARAFAQRYHTGEEEPFVARVAAGLPFDRAFWRMLVSEVLLVTAVDVPELQTAPQSLACLLAPGQWQQAADQPRGARPAILRAHQGSRDLTLGAAVYRPDHAGYNDATDVARLAAYLASVRPETWSADALVGLADLTTEEDRQEELAFAREWFAPLRELYQRAQEASRVIVVESIW